MLVAAAVCLLVAGLCAHVRLAMVDEGAFADRAVSTLHSDEVRQEVAARTGRRVVAERPELAPAEAMFESVVKWGVALDPGFQAEFRTAAARLHHALFWDPHADASLRIAGSGAALRADVVHQVPQVADDMPPIADPPLLTVGSTWNERALRNLAPWARRFTGPLAIVFGLAGLGLIALAIARGGDRRRAIWGSGLAIAAAGGVAAAGVTAAQDLVLQQFDTGYGDAVVTAVWNAYVGDLRMWALTACAAGLVIAATTGAPRLSAAIALVTPTTRGGRALRAIGLLAVAGLAVQAPQLVLHVVLTTAAAAAVYVAAGELLRVFVPRTA